MNILVIKPGLLMMQQLREWEALSNLKQGMVSKLLPERKGSPEPYNVLFPYLPHIE